MTMRVVHCNVCGEALSAANDDELERRLQQHMQGEHPSVNYDAAGARDVISREGYSASDS